MNYSAATRWLTLICFVLSLLVSVLGISGELYLEPWAGFEWPLLDDLTFVSALDVLFVTLLVCFLICFISSLLRRVSRPFVRCLLALPRKENLFDHGSRAPPLFC
ncbi:hypothetical protein [Marinobacterium weihaiense]|uniref:Uncharacterized protein n=1 Tax=Marinobacterium weihaiense TaxID=2851016 RepID=A0ABS6MB43_9GAMM|nr:hypothetical protein [Marinobacterium weihaiense]MBV0933532.1 hypothetical protein [Marinobacterium weihaiense]